jgi:hypothetical protein
VFNSRRSLLLPEPSTNNTLPNFHSDISNLASIVPEITNSKCIKISKRAFDAFVSRNDLKPKDPEKRKHENVPISKLRHYTCQMKTGMINSNKQKPVLYLTSNETITLFNSDYSHITSISASYDCSFAVIDYNFGVTIAYKICYKKDVISKLTELGSLLTSTNTVSSISSDYFLCSSVSKNYITLWNFMNCTVHRIIEVPFYCAGSIFDLGEGYIWVFGQTQLALITVNGTICSMINLSDTITNLVPRPNRSATVLLQNDVIVDVQTDDELSLVEC